MNLYLLSQTTTTGYDTTDSVVVAAKSPKDARKIHPTKTDWDETPGYSWARPADVDVEYIGKAGRDIKRGVILASFNAG